MKLYNVLLIFLLLFVSLGLRSQMKGIQHQLTVLEFKTDEMDTKDKLISNEHDYCFAKEGDVYAVYLKNGGTTNLDLRNVKGDFDIKWYNPRIGGEMQKGSSTGVSGGSWDSIGTAPKALNEDWVVLVKRR